MRNTANLINVDYLSAIEVRDEAIVLAETSSCTVTFDAIPIQILHYLRRTNSQEIIKNSDSALSFLLMEAVVPTSVFERAMARGGWCSITVSDPDVSGLEEGFYEATAFAFSEDTQEAEPKTLYVRINSHPPDAKDLQTLKRVIECRHHQSVAFDYLGILPKEELLVAVYDVGQANMCAIVEEEFKTRAFFDFGWPISSKRPSLPSCQNFDPLLHDDRDHPAPVFLSHLDWDHWGYAYKSGRPTRDARGFWKTQVTYRAGALERPWVMRRPSAKMRLGVSHAHLMYQLQNQRLSDGSQALKLWPSTRTQIQWGACKLFACDPASNTLDAKFLRNNVALGLLVECSQNYHSRRVLLCGDADYTSIPSQYKKNLCGVVAPHHGGRVTPNSIPKPYADSRTPSDVRPPAFMIFSTHEGSYSKIPSSETISEALEAGWTIVRTDDRHSCWYCEGERGDLWLSLAEPCVRCLYHDCRYRRCYRCRLYSGCCCTHGLIPPR